MSRKNNSTGVFKMLEAKAVIEEALTGASVETTYCVLRSLKDQTAYIRRHARDNHFAFVPAAELMLDVLMKTKGHLIYFYIKIAVSDAVNASENLLAMLKRDNSGLSYVFSPVDNDYACAELTDFDGSQNIKLWEVYDRDATIMEIVDGAGRYLSRDYEQWEKELNKCIVAHFNEPDSLLSKRVKKHILNQSKAQAEQFLNPEHQITP